jgi:hypothetical protein
MIRNDTATLNALDDMLGGLDEPTLELLGAAAASSGGGFNWGTLVDAAAEAAKQGVTYAEQKKADDAAAKNASAAALKAIAADSAWASAEQTLDIARQSGDQGRIAPAQALQVQAMQAAQAAGAGLSADAQAKRADAAQKALRDASTAALNAPGDQVKQALSRAWQKVVTSTPAPSTGSSGDAGSALALSRHGGGESWFTKKTAGLPTGVWVIGGGAVGVTALVMILKAVFGKKRR